MVDFTAKTFAENGDILSDLDMSATGEFVVVVPGPGMDTWTPRKRDGSGNYVLAANTGFGVASGGACAITLDELSVYIWHQTRAYRGRRSSEASDDFAYAPDNWNLATGAPRGGDISPDGLHLAVGAADTLTVYNTTTKGVVYTLNPAGTTDLVEHVQYSPDGQYLVAGWHNAGLKLFRRDGATYTQITTGDMAAPVGAGNWNICWHGDSEMFVACQYQGSSQGAWVWRLTDPVTHAFEYMDRTAAYDTPLAANTPIVAAAFLNHTDGKDYLLLGPYGAAAVPQLYRWGGSRFLLQPTTGLPGRYYEHFRGSRTGHSIVWSDTVATPKIGVWEFPTFAAPTLSVTVEADLPFADFEADVLTGALAEIEADLPFADFDAAGLTGADATVDGDLPFAEFSGALAAAEGVLPGATVRVNTAQVYSGAVGVITSSVVATDFAYILNQDLPFADFEASGLTGIDGEVNDDLPFADFEALAYQLPEATIEADLPFADVNIEAVIEKLSVTVEADLPFADFDIAGEIGFGAYVDGDLPFGDFDALVFQDVKATVEADLPFADFAATAGSPVSGEIEADLPFADLDGEVYLFKIDGEIEADLPFGDFDAELAAPLGVRVFGDLPFADLEAVCEVPIGVLGEADLPFADFDAYVTVPLRIDINSTLPFADFEVEARQVFLGVIEADLPFADFFAYTSGTQSVRGYSLAPTFGTSTSFSLGGGAFYGNETIKAG